MTFSCKYLDLNTEQCNRLKTDCIMGRRGCVLEGRVTLSEEIEKKLMELEGKTRTRKKQDDIP
jgi:hypothetical protein